MASVTPISSATPSTPAASQGQVQGDAVQAQVTKVPPSLENVDRTLTLRGEVQAVNEDGTVRIATPRGPVDVKLPDPQPTRGQQVEVQIPAGSPPRTATVTVQQQLPTPQPQPTPLPQTPPTQGQTPTPIPVPPGQAPTPQTPAPPVVQQQPPQAPIPTPAQTTPPAQTQTQTPVPPEASKPQAPAQNTPTQTPQAQPQAPQVSPQGLLNFLKNSLQTILKNPVAQNIPANAPDAPVRPLQLGQLVRLTPLPANQAAQALPQGTLTKTILPLPQSAASIATPLLTNTAQKPLMMPALPLQPGTQTPSQIILNPSVQIPGTTTSDAIARILLPFINASPAVPTAPITTQTLLPTLNIALQTPETIPTPHQPVLMVSSTQHTPILPQATDVRVAGILPNTAMPMPQALATANLLNGTPATPSLFAQVAGQTPQGLPVIALPTFTTMPDGTQKPADMLMTLQFPTRALAPNAILRLDILQQPQSLSPAMASAFAGDAITWDALDELIKTPNQTQAQIQAVQAGIPKPGGAAFSAPVLMFIAALRSGDITSWMGDKGIDAIKMSRRADTLNRIMSDFTGTARRMDDSAQQTGEWRSLNLPMLYGHELSRIQLYYRSFERDGDEAGSSDKQKGTRFVMDLSLTRMGPMQIDGFSIGKKLDVTLRSEQTLSPGMREAMRLRYSDAITGIGFAGSLNFSNDLEHKGWVVFENPATHESRSKTV